MELRILFVVIELMAFMVGLYTMKRLPAKFYGKLIFLLLITCLNESSILIDRYFFQFLPYKHNLAYNIFIVIEVLILHFIFLDIPKLQRFRTWILTSLMILTIGWAIEFIFIIEQTQIATLTLRVASIIYILVYITYLFQVLQAKFHLLHKDPFFIFLTGLFFFHACLIINITTVSMPGYWDLPLSLAIYRSILVFQIFSYYGLASISLLTAYLSKSKK